MAGGFAVAGGAGLGFRAPWDAEGPAALAVAEGGGVAEGGIGVVERVFGVCGAADGDVGAVGDAVVGGLVVGDAVVGGLVVGVGSGESPPMATDSAFSCAEPASSVPARQAAATARILRPAAAAVTRGRRGARCVRRPWAARGLISASSRGCTGAVAGPAQVRVGSGGFRAAERVRRRRDGSVGVPRLRKRRLRDALRRT
ncbi:hypothetical protein GCM10017674_59870 [Streptomyces gardneri]|uniref:Uncharacterized protein n=1 Tax=Streptomyces gardneri TaxID=66892 RepID=A0A4Y3RHP6_9ACTN|nr:hypothetical protein SGA01_29360 [Streptomyces gardneri]GHH13074.1 hypothetical protein GCM10017674_59870 [Streptomyces gardneri]